MSLSLSLAIHLVQIFGADKRTDLRTKTFQKVLADLKSVIRDKCSTVGIRDGHSPNVHNPHSVA